MPSTPPRIIHPDARPLRVTGLSLVVFAVAMLVLVIVVAAALSFWIAVPALVAMVWASAAWDGGDGENDRSVVE